MLSSIYGSYLVPKNPLPLGIGVSDGISFTIGNCFGQENFGTIKVQTDYKALKQCFKEVKLISHAHHRILIPYGIGCGLGGGDWRIVSKMIEDILGDCNVLIVKYNK